MKWVSWLIVGAVLVGMILWKRATLVSAETARQLLREGALVIDVREPGEFNAGHLPGALNIPLGQLSNSIGRRVADKNQVLLLHCLSGTRSGMARRQLQHMGYSQVFNLGSYGRAEQILRGAQR